MTDQLKRTDRETKAFEFWLRNPVEAVKDWFKITPDDWQGDALTHLFTKDDRVAIKSAHGPGKTATQAWADWIFLNCYADSRVVATAPTMAQLGDVLWPEICKWQSKMPMGMAEQWLVSGTHIRHVARPKLWFAVARTSNKPANLQGFHGTNILIDCEEASAIPNNVYEVIEGALSEAGEEGRVAKLILAGNPNFTAGEFYDAFGRNRRIYHRMTVTGDPDLLPKLKLAQGQEHKEHGFAYYSPRVKKKYADTMAAKYGRDGAVYDVRVRGVFPRVSDSAVIPLEWAQRAAGRDLPMFDEIGDPVTIVLDPARKGGNETVLGVFRRGVPCQPLQARAKTSTIESANMVFEEYWRWIKMGVGVARVIVDEPGVGGGVIDELQRLNIAVTPYNGGQSMVKGVDPDDECRMFQNRRSRDYWNVRRLLEMNLLPLPDDETLVAQAASIEYEYGENQKIVIESKKKLTDRLGNEASPDRIDVIVMGTAPWNSFDAANTAIQPTDVVAGQDRPQAEMDLW
jgi:phage terminase large subunit